MAFNPPFWGDTQTSKDYEMFMGAASPIDEPISLVGHSLTGLTPELIDPVTVQEVEKVRGKIVNIRRTLRAAEQIALTGTIGFGHKLWTPAMQAARRAGSACEVIFYAVRLCPSDTDQEHAYIWPEVLMNQPTRVNDPITIDETNPIEWQAEFTAPRELVLWSTAGSELTDLSDPLYAVAFLQDDCQGCTEDFYTRLVAVGGPGGGTAARVYTSDDRFGSYALMTHSAPAGSIANSVFVDGSVVLVGFANNVAPGSATTGGTLFSVDSGENGSLDTDITLPVWGVTKAFGQYVAVGGTTGDGGRVWTSADGTSWDEVSSDAIPTDQPLTAIDFDSEAGAVYVVGGDGTVLKGRSSGGTINFTELTDHGATGLLRAVNVFADDHVAIGGASGFYAESIDGGEDWTTPDVPGTAIVYAIAGTEERAMVGVASAGGAYVRDVLTKFLYEAEDYADGVTLTGDVTGIAIDKSDVLENFNYFAAVTDDGEVVLYKPNYPNS